jgi:hypothetical protein
MTKRNLTAAGVFEGTVKQAECGEPVQGTTARKVAEALGARPSRELGGALA